jgi:hypothetical protein
MSDTEDLLVQLRLAAEVEREAYKQEGATYINPMATICGRAATTIEEVMKMLIERDNRIALLEKACEASATYIRHDSLRPSAAHKNAFFRLCDAGYLGEGGDE